MTVVRLRITTNGVATLSAFVHWTPTGTATASSASQDPPNTSGCAGVPRLLRHAGIAPAMSRAPRTTTCCTSRPGSSSERGSGGNLRRRSGSARSIDRVNGFRHTVVGSFRRALVFFLEGACLSRCPPASRTAGPIGGTGAARPHDCAPEAGGDTGRCAGANRRAQRGDGTARIRRRR